MQPLTLMFGIDNNFVVPLAASLHSALDGLSAGAVPDVYVLSVDITDSNRNRLERMVGERANLFWPKLAELPIDETELATSANLPLAAFFRVFLLDLLPTSVDRILYLDADTVVAGDLRELWSTPVDDHIALAVRDPAVFKLAGPRGLAGWAERGLDPEGAYFNSGVLLINVSIWRSEAWTERFLSEAAQPGELGPGADQPILNAILVGRWGELAPRWNVQTEVLETATHTYPDDDHAHYVLELRARADELTTPPFVVHYTRARKPWHPACPNTQRQLFHEAIGSSGFFASTLAYRRWLLVTYFRWARTRVAERQKWAVAVGRLRGKVGKRQPVRTKHT